MTCYHTKIHKVGDKPWTCVKCGAELEPTHNFSLEAVEEAHVFVPGDPNDIPEEKRLRTPTLPKGMSGFEADKMYADRAKHLREMKRNGNLGRPEGMRYAGTIPPELYWAKRKEDPHYWNDRKNRNKHREFLVDPD